MINNEEIITSTHSYSNPYMEAVADLECFFLADFEVGSMQSLKSFRT